MEVRRRVKLEGLELEEYMKKKQESEAEARVKTEQIKYEMEDESSDESETEMEVDTYSASTVTKAKHDLMMKSEGKARTGFFKQAKKAYPMFPYQEERIKWDEYGEIIKPEDYTIAELMPADEEMMKKKTVKGGGTEVKTIEEVVEVPTKCISATVTLDINASVQYIDFEGRSDGESMEKILSKIKPRQLVLIRATTEATEALAEYSRNTTGMVQGKVFTPKRGDVVDATRESHIFQIKLRDYLVSALQFSKAKDADLAWIDGQLNMTKTKTDTSAMEEPEDGEIDEAENAKKKKSKTANGEDKDDAMELVPTLEALPHGIHVPGHKSVFINEPKLSDFKLVLLQDGIQAEFIAGVLICNNTVAVRKNEAGRIQLEGAICMDYFRVRDLLYSQYAIV